LFRKTASGILLFLLLISTLTAAFNIEPVKAEGETIYIRSDGSIDPPTAPIFTVDKITYTFTGNIYDSIVVERDNIVVDGMDYTVEGTGSETGIFLSGRSNVTIKNVYIKGFQFGISLDLSLGNNIYGNSITNNNYAIYLTSSSQNTFYGNKITRNSVGVELYSSSSNIFFRNNLMNNLVGFHLWRSVGNTLSGNNITDGSVGIRLQDATRYNGIFENNIVNNGQGVEVLQLAASIDYNTFYHNNFVNNGEQVRFTQFSTDIWDDGYPSGGNYWSDYVGVDLYSGPYQNETGNDGIGDRPYIIDTNNRDRYPLMNPWAPPPTPDFSIMASPGSLTIQQGSSDTSVITITSINNFHQPVQLTVYRAPSEVTATLSPEQVTPSPSGSITSTLTISVAITATPGSYTIIVQGNSGTLTHSVDISLEITSTLTLIPGKDVPAEAPDFFPSLLTKLDIPITEFAVQALTIWTNYENTNAYWNPLATTWDMGEKSWDFNEAGVKNYVDKETGVQATANTLALHYYESIREMLAIQSFNEQQLREAVATWSGLDSTDPYVVNLVNEWRSIYPENQPPVADAGQDQTVSSGDFVLFNGSNSHDPDGTIIRHRWDFGDGTIAEGKVVSHRFRGAQNQPKTYAITLTVEDDDGATNTDTVNVSVAPLDKTVEVSEPPILVRMTATYNWIEESGGENIYIISKIHVEANGFVGVFVPAIFVWEYQYPLGEIPVIDFLDYLFAKLVKTEKMYSPPFSTKPLIGISPPVSKRVFAEGTFEGIQVKGSDVMGIYAQGFKPKLGWPPIDIELFEFSSVAFEPNASPPESGILQKLLDELLDKLPDLIIGQLGSPGELRVYDSEGHITGLVNGKTKEEILNSAYFNNTVILLSSNSSYIYEVKGTQEGSYGLLIASFAQNKSTTFTATDIPISPNAIHQFTVDWRALSQNQQGVTIKVDSDGDEVFEKTFTSDNELTQDEFISQVHPSEGYSMWVIGVAVITIAIATISTAVFWRKRRQHPKKG
jgi:parallel beta-helix repeat protein